MSSLEHARRMGKGALNAMPSSRSLHPLCIEFEPSEHRQRVFREWQALELSLRTVPLSCSTGWVESWLSSYGDLVPHRFAVGRIDGRMCAATLVCQGVGQKDGPCSIRTLHLGTAGEPDQHSACVEYNAVLAEPGLHGVFLRKLLDTLRREHRWDEIRLDGFPLTDVEPHLLASTRRDVRSSRYFDLADARTKTDDPLALLRNPTRMNLRRKLRAYGQITAEWADTVARSHEIFEEMVALHQARWNAVGKGGAYASPHFLHFGRQLIDRLVGVGGTALIRVASQNEVIGCVHVLIDGDRVLKYQSGTVPYEGSRQSPGQAMDIMAIRACFERGYRAYDFLAGDNEAKRNLSTAVNELVWARLRQPSLKCAVLDVLRNVRRRIRGFTPDDASVAPNE
jgi:hypothetical protein